MNVFQKRVIDAAWSTGVLLLSMFVLVFFLFPQAQAIDSYLNPVKTDWQVLDHRFEGEDIMMSGTLIKLRDCSYLPPPRARDRFGNTYLVQSYSPTANLSWSAQTVPQKWGPWRVIGAKNRVVEFYTVDRCHFLWDNVTILGEFDGTQ